MTIDEAVKLSSEFADFTQIEENVNYYKTIKKFFEISKTFCLSLFAWQFAREKLSYRYPYILFFDKTLETLKSINYNTDELFNAFDVFYLLEKKYTIEEIKELFHFLSIFEYDKNLNNRIVKEHSDIIKNMKITPIREYFKYYYNIFSDKNFIPRQKNVLFIVNPNNRRPYQPLETIEAVVWTNYKETRDKFVNNKFINIINLIKDDPEKVKTYFENSDILDFSYILETNTECTINKDVEELPDIFVHLVCKYTAKEINFSNQLIDVSNVRNRSVEKDLAVLQQLYASENAHVDLKEVTDYDISNMSSQRSTW